MSKLAMNLKTLEKLVAQGEGQHLEFKLKANHPDKIVREIVAFANAKGGQLLIGISDFGEIKGLKYSSEDEFVLEREIERSISPTISYSIERIKLTYGNEVLIFSIPSGKEKPYSVIQASQEIEKKVYFRVADKSIQASKELRQILKGLTKDKDLRFNYGEKENILMKFLAENEYITLSNFVKIANIPAKVASRTLVLLVLTNVLRIEAHEVEDRFMAI